MYLVLLQGLAVKKGLSLQEIYVLSWFVSYPAAIVNMLDLGEKLPLLKVKELRKASERLEEIGFLHAAVETNDMVYLKLQADAL